VERKGLNEWPSWPNSRDWIAIGTFVLTVMLLWMMKGDPELMKNDFFKTIATLIIGTGFVNGPVAWAFSTTKSGTEAAESNAKVAQQQTDVPKEVKVVNEPSEPVQAEIAVAGEGELPEHEKL
jgi:hypothetical protein